MLYKFLQIFNIEILLFSKGIFLFIHSFAIRGSKLADPIPTIRQREKIFLCQYEERCMSLIKLGTINVTLTRPLVSSFAK